MATRTKMRRFAAPADASASLRFEFGVLDVPGQQALEAFDREGRKVLLGLGGIRGGKSWYGSRWALKQAHHRGGLGWIVVPDYSYASEIVRLINDVLYQHWEVVVDHREHPYPMWRLKFGVGAQIEIRSAYDPDQIRASTLSWAWMDEAARQSPIVYKNLEQRVLSTRGPILMTTTPKGKNWVYKEVYLPSQRGREDIGVALMTTRDNPHLPPDEIGRLQERWGPESPYAAQELAAEFVAFEGLCYQFDEDRHAIPPETVPARHRLNPVVAGVDWGWSDPCAVVVLGKSDGVWYQFDELYQTALPIEELKRQLASLKDLHRIERFWFSWERPEIVRHLRDGGLPVHLTRKGDVGEGIAAVDALLRRDHYKISRTCANTINEFGLYQYRASKAGVQKPGERPVDRFNHAMDALRMAMTSESGMPRGTVDLRLIRQPSWR